MSEHANTQSVNGANVRLHKLSVDAPSINAGAVADVEVAIPDLKAGDAIFVSNAKPSVAVVVQGVAFKEAGKANITFFNPTAGALNADAVAVFAMVWHLTNP